jgi:hypothetical protein
VALTAVLGVPLVLAAWHARGDVRVAQHVMTWLPLVWNAAGLVLASQLVPDVVARALRTQGAWVVAGELGDGHAATRVMAALGHEAAEILEPEPSDETTVSRGELPALRSTLGAPLAPDAMRVAFSGSREGGRDNGTAIVVQVRVEGPGGALTLPYLFDTGASFTTISRATAASLGIAIAPDAPTLKFNTASGLRESQMVHLPALSLGHARVEGLLVSICDECVNEHTAGLLGLNVVREFLVEMDYVEREMTLRPRPSERLASGRRDRAYDIEPVVQIEVEGAPEVWLGRVRWVLRVRNRGAVPLYDVVPEVQFTHGATLQGAVIPRVEPGEVGRSLVEGRASSGRDDSGGEFTLHLRRASW